MADENGTTETKKRSRKTPQRRSYATELVDLQKKHTGLTSKVDFAVRILRKAITGGASGTVSTELVNVAIETLSGE